MKYYLFFLIGIIFWSCKKKKVINGYPNGIYVEETLRLDTMDFTINTFIDATSLWFNFKQPINLTLPPYPTLGNNNGLYEFQIKNNNTIDLRSMLSSNSNFQNYYFNWQNNNSFFEMDKFYIRPNLPNKLKFIKL